MRATKISQPITISRKCDCCKEIISINKNNVDDAIFYDKNPIIENASLIFATEERK